MFGTVDFWGCYIFLKFDGAVDAQLYVLRFGMLSVVVTVCLLWYYVWFVNVIALCGAVCTYLIFVVSMFLLCLWCALALYFYLNLFVVVMNF